MALVVALLVVLRGGLALLVGGSGLPLFTGDVGADPPESLRLCVAFVRLVFAPVPATV